ncbi:MAG: DUF924 family protein [Alphaproteobacteria bacterium]
MTRAAGVIAAARARLPAPLGAVLGFWFGAPDAPDYGASRDAWFTKDPAFDQVVRDRFGALHDAVLAGTYDPWLGDPDGALAMIVALDQFARNMYRGSPRMYAADQRARSLARATLGHGHDAGLTPVERWFVYLPFEHSEDIADQRRAIELFDALAWHEQSRLAIDSARRHHDIVARFGRFPHRNAILGRATTAAETAFLLEPTSSF